MRLRAELNERLPEEPGQIVASMVAAPVGRTCSPFSTVTEAVLIFKDENCDMIPVVNEGKPVGMVTDRNVALAVVDVPALAEQPVSRIMATTVTTVPSDAPIDQVIKAMITENAETLFMIDGNGRLDGLISWPDVTGRVPLGYVTGLIEPAVAEAGDS